jgi:recombination protein RecT
MMTGPGTNTYLIGDQRELIVIDPGPDDPTHIDRIAEFAAGRIKLILCTHSHPDHSPGAWLLKQRCGAPVAGMAAGPPMPQAWQFEPDRALVDRDRVQIAGLTLRVLHTPGHMSNHLCYLAEEDQLLFCGDHILNGSTTVINPPDGDMSAYLGALDRLRREPIQYLLPAHGHVLGPAIDAIDKLIAHRLRREDKVLNALRTTPDSEPSLLVRQAYDDTPVALHGLAQRSLLAHLIKLERDGKAERIGDRWRVS